MLGQRCLLAVLGLILGVHGRPDIEGASSSAGKTKLTQLLKDPTSMQCKCNTTTAWLNIVFLIDSSGFNGADGLAAMWRQAQALMKDFNVQNATHRNDYIETPYFSRVGVITYSKTATTVYPLGSLDNKAIADIAELPYDGYNITNLEAGLAAALDEYQDRGFDWSRFVIVVMASAYSPDGVKDPNDQANFFKQEDDAIILVYNSVRQGAVESPKLKEIASPGYFYSSVLNSQQSDLTVGLCDANCFCAGSANFTSSSVRNTPSDGCYYPIDLQFSHARVVKECKEQFLKATLSYDESAAKTTFLQGLFPAGSSFYIGLTYDNIGKTWQWQDGSELGAYQPWANGTAHDGTNREQCAVVNSNGQWQPVNCFNQNYYICQLPPCDSERIQYLNDYS